MPDTIIIPGLRPIVRHAVPTIVECNLAPLGIFLALISAVSAIAAIMGALAWTLAALLRRVRARRVTPGMLVLTTVALTTRSVVALLTGSLFVYFLQPTAGTLLVGLAFLISVPLGRPLAERLAHDICPFEESTRSHPALRAFLANVSLLWAVASLMNFGITLWLLLTQSTTTFVLVKSVLGPTITVSFSIVAILWFRSRMARSGISVIWRSNAVA